MFSCSQQLLIYVLSKLLSQAVWRRLGRQRLYHIWAPCAHFRASNTHICFAPPQNHKTFVSHWLAKSMITLWTLTLTFELHWAICTPFQLIELGNVLVQTWDDAQDPSPFLFTCTCRFTFPEKLASALKGLYKSQFLVKSSNVGLGIGPSHLGALLVCKHTQDKTCSNGSNFFLRTKLVLYNSLKSVIFQ